MSEQDSMDVEETPLEPADELEWLREQYVVLKQNNDSLRQAYSAVGQEASALRRALASRAPTLRERAAVAVLPLFMGDAIRSYNRTTDQGVKANWPRHMQDAVDEAVKAADMLVKELANG